MWYSTGNFTGQSTRLGNGQQTSMSCSLGGLSELHAVQWLSSPTRIFARCFPSLPAPAYRLAIQQTHCHCSSAVTEEETLSLWRTPWEAGLAFLPPAVCAHSFSSCYQWLGAPCRLPCLETPFSAPEWMKGGETAPAQGPLTITPIALPLAVCFGLFPTELQGPGSGATVWAQPLNQLLLTKQAEISPGYSWQSLPKFLAKKAKKWSRASSCEVPGQPPLPFSGSSLQGSRLPAFMNGVPQINKHRDTSKEIWLLSEACWLMISAKRLLCRSLFDFHLFYTVLQEDLRRAENQGSPPLSWCTEPRYRLAQVKPRKEEEIWLEKLVQRQFYFFFPLNHSLWQIIRDQLSLQLPILYLTYAVRVWSPSLEGRHPCLALISLKQF